jgi:hypothetical protein
MAGCRRDEVAASLDMAADAMKRQYDRGRSPAVPFEVGALVLIDAKNIHQDRPKKKLADKKLGPFKVTEVLSPKLYRLELPPSWRHSSVFNIERLSLYRDASFAGQLRSRPTIVPSLPLEVEPPAVTAVHNHRLTRTLLTVLVSMNADHGPEDAIWEDASALHDPDHLVTAYCVENDIAMP